MAHYDLLRGYAGNETAPTALLQSRGGHSWSTGIRRSRPGEAQATGGEIERKLAEDGARPIIFYDRRATCWQPHVKVTIMVNSVFSGARMEDAGLDK